MATLRLGAGLGARAATSSPASGARRWAAPQNDVDSMARPGDDERRPRRRGDAGANRWPPPVGGTGDTARLLGLVGLERGSVAYWTIRLRWKPIDKGLAERAVDGGRLDGGSSDRPRPSATRSSSSRSSAPPIKLAFNY